MPVMTSPGRDPARHPRQPRGSTGLTSRRSGYYANPYNPADRGAPPVLILCANPDPRSPRGQAGLATGKTPGSRNNRQPETIRIDTPFPAGCPGARRRRAN